MRSDLQQGLRWLALAAFWVALIGASLVTALPTSPLTPSLRERSFAIAFIPEGWAFFTRDPREPVIVLYRRSGSSWVEKSTSNALPEYWFGIRRTGRIESMGLHSVLRRVPASEWKPCLAEVNECVRTTAPNPVEVRLREPAELLLGKDRELLVRVRSVVPWAWRDGRSPEQMPSRIVWLQLVEEGPA